MSRPSSAAVGGARDETTGSDERTRAIVFGVLLFAGAFVLRFAAARWLAGEPVWDGHYYDFGARRIAEGHGYSDDRVVDGRVVWHPWCHYPVGYSAFLAAFYRVLGTHAWVAHVANGLTGALLAVAVWLLASEALSDRRARLAGILTAIHPGLVLYGALVMGEVLSALTVVAAFVAALRGARAWGPVRGVALGAVVLGVGALVRPQALLCAPFLAVVVTRDLGPARDVWLARGRAAVVACVVALLPILPWTARNCRVMDGCALVSTNAGWNLAIGAFPRATGRFETLRSSDGCREVTGQVQQDRCWLQYGISHIKASPGRWLGLIPAKLSNTFDHESFSVEYLREARPEAWPEERRVRWRTVITAAHRLLIVASPLAFLAFVVPRRKKSAPASREPRSDDETREPLDDGVNGRRARWGPVVQGALLAATALSAYLAFSADSPTFWPIVIGASVLACLPLPGRPSVPPALVLAVALLATTALTHAVFFGDDRYHVVVTPVLCLLATAALREPRNTHGANTLGARAAESSSAS